MRLYNGINGYLIYFVLNVKTTEYSDLMCFLDKNFLVACDYTTLPTIMAKHVLHSSSIFILLTLYLIEMLLALLQTEQTQTRQLL